MKKVIKVLTASTIICLMAVGLSTNSNNIKKNNSVDLLSFSLKSAQAHGEDTNHNHGPTVNPFLSSKYCGNTNAYSCTY